MFTDDLKGIGKVTAVRDTTCEVSFFHSIAVREEQVYSLSSVRPAILASQTRVYVRESKDSWRIGRVVDRYADHGTVAYDISFPNNKFARVPEAALQVRCYGPAIDPTEVLAWYGMETEFFHDRRIRATEALLAARATSAGLTGLSSAAVEMVPHQVEVVRRVLEDPIQRYLLADEVGMGKTIEAGALIRQCLLDEPGAHIVVLAPAPLLRQWEEELHTKFYIDEFPTPVEIRPFDELDSVPSDGCDLLIVDEAHHLINANLNSDARLSDQPAFQHLVQVAHASRRLLLLSATPVIGNEEATLAMLHLLDPSIYRLDDMQGFRRKLEKRQEYGRLLLTLNPQASPLMLRLTNQRLLQLFPDDPVVIDLATQLAQEGIEPEVSQAIMRALKLHIAETYRLHQRLVRTRRKDIVGGKLRSRHGPLTVDPELDERIPLISDALEEWRYRSRHHVQSEDLPSRHEATLAHRYARMVEALGIGIEEYAQEVESQWREVKAGKLATFVDEATLVTVQRDAVQQDSSEMTRLDLVSEALKLAVRAAERVSDGRPKILAFTSSTAFGRRLKSRLISLYGKDAVCSVFDGDMSDDIDSNVERFRDVPEAAVMIGDRTVEEGFNFPFVNTIVHLDLPLSPTRIEQRIGRADRFGRTQASLNQRILLPTDEDSPWAAWFDILKRGFRIFDESISDVQFLLDEITERIVVALYREGGQCSERLIGEIHEQLRLERTRLDEQYALDQLDIRDDSARIFDDLARFDIDEEHFGHAIDSWTQGVLQFHERRMSSNSDTFQLAWSKRTLVPKNPWYTWFLPSLDRKFTYSRSTATARADTCLLRPGAQFLDTLQRYMRWDDRGTTFATWRIDRDWASTYGDDWVGFRLCYIVGANVEHIGEDGELDGELLPAIQRRADTYLPSTSQVLYLDASLSEVTDPQLREILSRPYKDERDGTKRRDYNLGSRHQALSSVIDHADFVKLCRQVRSASEELLRRNAVFSARIEEATQQARKELTLRNERLQRRIAAAMRQGSPDDPSLKREIAINCAVIDAVALPSVRLDAIGFFIIAAGPPDEDAP